MSKKKGSLNQRTKREFNNIDLLQKFTFSDEIAKNPSRTQGTKDIYQINEKPILEQEPSDHYEEESDSKFININGQPNSNNLSKNNVTHPVPDRFLMYQSQDLKGTNLVRDYLNERQTSIKINKAILQSSNYTNS